MGKQFRNELCAACGHAELYHALTTMSAVLDWLGWPKGKCSHCRPERRCMRFVEGPVLEKGGCSVCGGTRRDQTGGFCSACRGEKSEDNQA